MQLLPSLRLEKKKKKSPTKVDRTTRWVRPRSRLATPKTWRSKRSWSTPTLFHSSACFSYSSEVRIYSIRTFSNYPKHNLFAVEKYDNWVFYIIIKNVCLPESDLNSIQWIHTRHKYIANDPFFFFLIFERVHFKFIENRFFSVLIVQYAESVLVRCKFSSSQISWIHKITFATFKSRTQERP